MGKQFKYLITISGKEYLMNYSFASEANLAVEVGLVAPSPSPFLVWGDVISGKGECMLSLPFSSCQHIYARAGDATVMHTRDIEEIDPCQGSPIRNFHRAC